MKSPSILLIGCGKMGGALLRGWHAAGQRDISVIDTQPLPPDLAPLASHAGSRLADVVSPVDVIVLAVKPQQMDAVLSELAAWPPVQTALPLMISIAAGRTLASLARPLPATQPMVRSMPNLPAAVHRGITVACANHHVTSTHRDWATRLLSATGALHWIDDESHLDAVTAVSGSGPAYVFLLVEAMTKAGIDAGLPPVLATALARQTVAGSGALLDASPDLSAAILRGNVTSPGGTTAAALTVLMGKPGLQDLMTQAVATAKARSRELSN
jgi:pyrroline-5-carboxylate reductase